VPSHHVIISGTGRAGTTLLIQLLTALGLETGFSDPFSKVRPGANAGMEWNIRRRPDAPYIIKSPFLCEYLDEIVSSGSIVVDHAIVPLRDLYAAAQSRRETQKLATPASQSGSIAGGLWRTEDPEQQEAVLTEQLYKLILALARHDIPTTLLYFPRFARDPGYLYAKLAFMMDDISYESFLGAFTEIVKTELIHDYQPDGST
jgi:hypothetical protein